jgi:predicted AAA+ superfamily ATPase
MKYIKRIIEPIITRYAQLFPVVAITGPRQTGKSTTLINIFKDYKYVTFDDYKVIDFFTRDPEAFMELYNNKVIFDEAQKVPELFNYVKIAVDNDRSNYGKFILTGSSQFTFMTKISESLAGRIGLLSMLPFQFKELPNILKDDSIFKGGYPELVTRKYEGLNEWYESYINTYIEKDVRTLLNIGDLRDFRRLITLLAANTAQVLNMSKLSLELGVAVQTIKRWVSVLEASYIIFLLPTYYKNFGKRVRKLPKIYFYDTGLVSFLTGIKDEQIFENSSMSGSIFENYIVLEIYKKELANNTHSNLYYFRTSNQEEIDLIVDRKTHKELIEIKSSKSFKSKMISSIEKFLEPNDVGYLLFMGKEFQYKPNIKIWNYKDYLNL